MLNSGGSNDAHPQPWPLKLYSFRAASTLQVRRYMHGKCNTVAHPIVMTMLMIKSMMMRL